jgi:hypothetical protein
MGILKRIRMLARRGWLIPVSNPTYLGVRDQKDRGSNPDGANSFPDPISEIPSTKRVGSMAQVVEGLPSKW